MNNEREKQMMQSADEYAAEMRDESSTGAQVAETINDFCAGWRAADNSNNGVQEEIKQYIKNNLRIGVDIEDAHYEGMGKRLVISLILAGDNYPFNETKIWI